MDLAVVSEETHNESLIGRKSSNRSSSCRGSRDVELLRPYIGVFIVLDSLDSTIRCLIEDQAHARKPCDSDVAFIMDRNITKAFGIGLIPLLGILIILTDLDKAIIVDVYSEGLLVTYQNCTACSLFGSVLTRSLATA